MLKMERQKFDNGLLLVAYLSNVIAPLGILIYFGISYLQNPENEDNLIMMIPLSVFSLVFLLMFFRFKKVEFDDQYVYVKSLFNKEIDSFPIQNIRSVKKMMLTFGGKGRRRSGKNYKITYLNYDGAEKKVRVMATTSEDVVNNFIKATSFLGPDGFNPE
jgi:hypothetical protein